MNLLYQCKYICTFQKQSIQCLVPKEMDTTKNTFAEDTASKLIKDVGELPTKPLLSATDDQIIEKKSRSKTGNDIVPDNDAEQMSGGNKVEELVVKDAFSPAPNNLICPEPLPRLFDADDEMFSGSTFHPVINQSRRDMYGGDLRKGIPNGFQHILYDISNAVIRTSNYGQIHPDTRKVFNGKSEILQYLALYLEQRLVQRYELNGKPTGNNSDLRNI